MIKHIHFFSTVVEIVGDNAGDNLHMNYWDSKKISPSRPKSCEVPNIK